MSDITGLNPNSPFTDYASLMQGSGAATSSNATTPNATQSTTPPSNNSTPAPASAATPAYSVQLSSAASLPPAALDPMVIQDTPGLVQSLLQLNTQVSSDPLADPSAILQAQSLSQAVTTVQNNPSLMQTIAQGALQSAGPFTLPSAAAPFASSGSAPAANSTGQFVDPAALAATPALPTLSSYAPPTDSNGQTVNLLV